MQCDFRLVQLRHLDDTLNVGGEVSDGFPNDDGGYLITVAPQFDGDSSQ